MRNLEAGLERMLDARISEQQANRSADQLHETLFANRYFDVPFDRARQGSPDLALPKEIQAFADDDASISLLSNLPWELTRDTISRDEFDQKADARYACFTSNGSRSQGLQQEPGPAR